MFQIQQFGSDTSQLISCHIPPKEFPCDSIDMLFDYETDKFGLGSDYDFVANLSHCDLSDEKSESSENVAIDVCVCPQIPVDISPLPSLSICTSECLSILPCDPDLVVSGTISVNVFPKTLSLNGCGQDTLL